MEGRFLYFPTRELAATPQALGLRAEELSVLTEDGVRLHGWWIQGVRGRAVLFFHGNAGNAGDRLDRARILNERFGLDVFLVDYRGYGRSEGHPSEEGLYRDSRAVHEIALDRGFRPGQIVVFGESLGSAVAIQLAIDRPCAGVILETPFLSIAAMARKYYPFVPTILIRTRFDNEGKIGAVAPPKLFLIAERDEVVPADQGRRLFERAKDPKTLFVIPGSGHNDTYVSGGEPYWKAWTQFLASLPAGG
ncbi:MAG: alpha/beta hydrolase, partial [Acidobacteriota bacterium]